MIWVVKPATFVQMLDAPNVGEIVLQRRNGNVVVANRLDIGGNVGGQMHLFWLFEFLDHFTS